MLPTVMATPFYNWHSVKSIGDDSMVVVFNDGTAYIYNSERPGADYLNEMKRLAADGEGLNSYINRIVKKRYASKLR